MQAFLAHMDAFGQGPGNSEWVDVWIAAQLAFRRLQEKEAGCADDAALLPLPASMQAQAQAVQQCVHTSLAHSRVPVAFNLVEFDGLMSSSCVLQQAQLQAVQARVQTAPDDAELAAICLQTAAARDATGTPETVASWDGNGLSVLSSDRNIRLLQAQLVSALAPGLPPAPGLAAAALQVAVGSSVPVMHVAKLDGRALLVKGHHRARVLRALGVNYLPCLVSVCTSTDDVLAVAPWLQRSQVEAQFESPRPVMVRDFDRPSLVHSHEARTRRRLLQLKLEVSAQWLP
jgi:hypothetical protein